MRGGSFYAVRLKKKTIDCIDADRFKDDWSVPFDICNISEWKFAPIVKIWGGHMRNIPSLKHQSQEKADKREGVRNARIEHTSILK